MPASAAIIRLAEETAARQGLPPKVTDPRSLAKVAVLLDVEPKPATSAGPKGGDDAA